MKRLIIAASTLCAGIFICTNLLAEEENNLLQQRREKIQVYFAKVRQIREMARQYRNAVIAGENQKADEILAKLKDSYQSLPEQVKEKIEIKHPGTAERIMSLSPDDVDKDFKDEPNEQEQSREINLNSQVYSESKSVNISRQETVEKIDNGVFVNSGTTTTPGGETFTNEGVSTREGNTITHEGTVKNKNEEIVSTRKGTIVKDANTVTHNLEVTNQKTGNTRALDAEYTKEGDTISYDKTITTQNGKTIETEGTITKEGNTLKKEGTINTEKGTFNIDGTITKEANTLTGHSELTNEKDEIIRTKDLTSTKEGNTRNTEVTTKWTEGPEYKRETRTTREESNSIKRETQINAEREKKQYESDLDLLGKGFKKRENSLNREKKEHSRPNERVKRQAR